MELWVFSFVCNYTLYKNHGFWLVNNRCIFRVFSYLADFPKRAEKLSVIRTDRHEDLVRPKNILPVRKKSPKKFTVMCIMFCLAFLECFTIVLAIGHLISPLVFIEVKVIQFLVFSVVQNCICYVFGLSSFLALSQSIECKFFTIRQYLWWHSDCVKFNNSNNILITSISEIKQ